MPKKGLDQKSEDYFHMSRQGKKMWLVARKKNRMSNRSPNIKWLQFLDLKRLISTSDPNLKPNWNLTKFYFERKNLLANFINRSIYSHVSTQNTVIFPFYAKQWLLIPVDVISVFFTWFRNNSSCDRRSSENPVASNTAVENAIVLYLSSEVA